MSKKSNVFRNTVLLFTFLTAGVSANADLLGSGSFNTGFGSDITPITSENQKVQVLVWSVLSGGNSSTILGDLVFTIDSPDFVTTFSSGPTFNALSNLLTNGRDNTINFGISIPSNSSISPGIQQSRFFAGSPGLTKNGSFEGSSIDRVEFAIINKITTPGENPNNDGIWTDWYFDFAMKVYGTAAAVPEPNGSVLLLLGLGCLLGVDRFRILTRKSFNQGRKT